MTPLAAPAPPASSLLTRVAVGVSIGVHVCAVFFSLGYAGAGLFEAPEPDSVQVSLVAPQDVPAAEPQMAPQEQQKPEPDLSQLDLRLDPTATKPATPMQKDAATQAQPAPAPSPIAKRETSDTAAQQQAAAASPPPGQSAYLQPLPDISMRYGVDLGLKMLAPSTQAASAQDGTSDFDAPAMQDAKIERSHVAAFRERLKQCAALPQQIAPDDKVVIVLRASFTPDARLAGAPVLIEASASAKGPALMQAAIKALEACQPYAALPAQDYAEWRTLDLRFTPQDFRRN